MTDPYKPPESSSVHNDHSGLSLNFKNLFLSFDGRIDRRSFWTGFVVYLALKFVQITTIFYWPDMWLWILLFSIPAFYLLFAVIAKRYHDLGKSGWHGLIWLAPFVGWIFVIVECGFGKGSPMRNQYGAPLVGPLVKISRE